MGRTLIAVPLISSEPSLAEQARRAAAAGANLVELRVDLIQDDAAVETFLRGPRPLPVILTARSRAEGGGWGGDEASRRVLYARFAQRLDPSTGAAQQADFVDLEFAAWRDWGAAAVETGDSTFPDPARLILSHHDWHGTPEPIDSVAGPLLQVAPGIPKLVFTPADALDAWRLMRLLREHTAHRPLIVLGMGAGGVLTRILAAKFGGFLTFATLEKAAESAPGQPTVKELREVYKFNSITPGTQVFGVVGWPAAHSRGPHIHNAAMHAGGIDGVYVPMPVQPTYERFAALMDYLTANPALGVCGLSVTIPHKAHALRWLRERGHSIAEAAVRCGAVNTLVRASDAPSWRGDNTDIAGILTALNPVVKRTFGAWRDLHAVVLGAGGGARAALAALRAQGCRITIHNRTQAKAAALAEEFGAQVGEWPPQDLRDVQLILNCTNVGMAPHADETPISPALLTPPQVVFDMVYTPARTKLLNSAEKCGCEVVSGEAMFLGQAAAQYLLWHGCPPTPEIMASALASSC